jgi:hypothetical protein
MTAAACADAEAPASTSAKSDQRHLRRQALAGDGAGAEQLGDGTVGLEWQAVADNDLTPHSQWQQQHRSLAQLPAGMAVTATAAPPPAGPFRSGADVGAAATAGAAEEKHAVGACANPNSATMTFEVSAPPSAASSGGSGGTAGSSSTGTGSSSSSPSIQTEVFESLRSWQSSQESSLGHGGGSAGGGNSSSASADAVLFVCGPTEDEVGVATKASEPLGAERGGREGSVRCVPLRRITVPPCCAPIRKRLISKRLRIYV